MRSAGPGAAPLRSGVQAGHGLLRRVLRLRDVAELSLVKADFRLELRGRRELRSALAVSSSCGAALRRQRPDAECGASVFDVDGTLPAQQPLAR